MRKRMSTAIFAGIGMILLILDSRTALAGAYTGVDLCIRTVIPSLFPFFVLSTLLTGALSGISIPILRPLRQLCGIPKGAEAVLVPGFLGGYPVGAQAVVQCYSDGSLTIREAQRLLGFCSNAGPAFLFGMGTSLFGSVWVPAVLWGIHLFSAASVGALLPGKSQRAIPAQYRASISPLQAMGSSIRILGSVCGWVVLFRIIIAFMQRWFLWLLTPAGQVAASGFLELTNGFCALSSVQPLGLRFVLASVFLAFGGVCVTMQTASVTGAALGIRSYLTGKILQTVISLCLSSAAQFLLFAPGDRCSLPPALLLCPSALAVAYIYFLRKVEKGSSNSAPMGV